MSAPSNHDVLKNGNNDSEDAAPIRTRTRVSRACTRCRQRKDKCDGGTPSCANCLNADQPCSYDQATKKRGLPEGYVRAIEKLWAVTFTRIPGIEGALLQMLSHDRDLLTTIWNHREIGEELHSRWKDSRTFQELESFLTNADHSAATGSKRKRERDDEEELDGSLGLNTILPPRYGLSDLAQSGVCTQNVPSPSSPYFQLPSGASELLSHYFKFTHCWFPILDRPQTLKQCYELSRQPSETNEKNGALAVLAAVLAYSAQQQSLGKGSSLPSLDADEMAKVARQCIPSLSGSFNPNHLQALLILALGDLTAGRWEMAWRAVGLVSRVLLEILSSSAELSREWTAIRQGSLILDTLISIKLDRSPQLLRSEQQYSNCLRPDGHEEWEPWPGTAEPAFVMSCFNELTMLQAKLSQYFCENQMASGQLANERTEEILAEMSTLATNYPPASQPLNSRTGPPHQTWLKVAHLSASAFVAATQESKVDLAITYLGSLVNALKDLEKSTAPELLHVPAWTIAPTFAALRQLKSLVERNRYAAPPKHVAVLKGFAKYASNVLQAAAAEISVLVDHITKGREASVASASTARRVSSSTSTTSVPPQPLRRQTFFPVDPFAQSALTRSASNSSQMPNLTMNGPGIMQSPGSLMQVDWGGVIDIPTGKTHMPEGGLVTRPSPNSSRNDTTGLYNPSIATSPSYQGDEIDALFHEMAQLDTTEWTSGRNQGLKDFGFDDLSFEQFCNDPDRLFSGGFVDQQQPMLHNRQGSDFQMPDLFPQPQNFGYNMPENSWPG